jgi:hypothetical protein
VIRKLERTKNIVTPSPPIEPQTLH